MAAHGEPCHGYLPWTHGSMASVAMDSRHGEALPWTSPWTISPWTSCPWTELPWTASMAELPMAIYHGNSAMVKLYNFYFAMDTWSMEDLHGNPYHRSHVHDEMRHIYMNLCRIGDLVIDLRINMKHTKQPLFLIGAEKSDHLTL